MKKDIPIKKVKDLAIAIIPRPALPDEEELWDVYLINMQEEAILNVLVRSQGYDAQEGAERRTTVLRHFFDEIDAKAVQQVEPIHQSLFALTNEYWVSFTQGDYMYDKKYVFVKGSIDSQHFTLIPLVNRDGIMIR
ncbi:MAG: hypothetical protein KDC44_24720 [Phaeodactylibacter sp.]|nr:hypothetical protein [Phaeodactylibacter sp.]